MARRGRPKHPATFCRPLDGCRFCERRMEVLRALGAYHEAYGCWPTASKLAQQLGLTPGSIAPLLGWLEAGGYVERFRYAAGRRLTEKGWDALRESNDAEAVAA